MNELARHIEHLLLSNDCVTVPHFGGFVTCHVPAERVDDEDLFLPPQRTVRFNPALQESDGLLVHSLMKTYRVEETEAKRKLHALVLELRQTLLENGSCDFGSLGVFAQNEDGEVSFAPCQAGIVCPEYYGLDALSFPLLSRLPAVVPTTDEAAATPTAATSDGQHITIRIPRRWVNVLTATAAAVVLFFLFSTPVKNTDTEALGGGTATASLYLPAVVSETVSADEEPMPSAASLPKDEAAVSETKAAPTEPRTDARPAVVEPETVETIAPETDTYCVVVASSVTEKNAHAFVEHLTRRGIEGAQVFKKGKMVRVIFPGYATEAEAYRQARTLRSMGGDLASAWVYELK